MIFEEWPTKALEKNQLLLRDALKKGISDADAEARRHSRKYELLAFKHESSLTDFLDFQILLGFSKTFPRPSRPTLRFARHFHAETSREGARRWFKWYKFDEC